MARLFQNDRLIPQGYRYSMRIGFMSCFKRTLRSGAWLFSMFSSIVYANGYEFSSKHMELKGHVVIDAGEVEKIEPPFGKIGASETLKLGTNCFYPFGIVGIRGGSKKAGIVLVDPSRTLKLALIESSMGSINVELLSVMPIACPTAGSDGLPQDPELRLQELKRRQEFLERELRRIRQQQ